MLPVLSAWANWSVFDSGFIDELECKFEGKEVKKAEDKKVDETNTTEESEQVGAEAEKETAIVSTIPRGTWSTAKDDEPETTEGADLDGDPIDGDLDGDDIDGESLGDEDVGEIDRDDIDGESLASGDLIVDEDCDDLDGEEVGEADLEDGEALDDEEAGA